MSRKPMNEEFWWIRTDKKELTIGKFYWDSDGGGYFVIIGGRVCDAHQVHSIAHIEPPSLSHSPDTQIVPAFGGSP
jgi:hypothetical protein